MDQLAREGRNYQWGDEARSVKKANSCYQFFVAVLLDSLRSELVSRLSRRKIRVEERAA
jgi:hypothetical protein